MAQPSGSHAFAPRSLSHCECHRQCPRDTCRRTVAAGQIAVAILREGQAAGTLKLAPKERNWLDRIEKELQSSPASEDELLGQMSETYGEFFLASSYGL